MTSSVQFHIHYFTQWGEQLYLKVRRAGQTGFDHNALDYKGNGSWTKIMAFREEDYPLIYAYQVCDQSGNLLRDEGDRLRRFEAPDQDLESCFLKDTWIDRGHPENAFFTKAFSPEVLPQTNRFRASSSGSGFIRMQFHLRVPYPYPNARLVVLGNANALGDWNPARCLLLSNASEVGDWSGCALFNEFPEDLQYKYAWLLADGSLLYETGDNRNLRAISLFLPRRCVFIQDVGFRYVPPFWRGAGVAIPVFSLRSQISLGVGDFHDLILLADWAAASGLKMVQILPVNDTQASGTWSDSYPYAAISVFALHPLYLHIEGIPNWENAVDMTELNARRKDLEALPAVDYELALSSKLDFAKKIFTKEWSGLSQDTSFRTFLNENRNWLLPYAWFCCCRDNYGTVDFSQWGERSHYDEKEVTARMREDHSDHLQLAFHFFLQFHLDRQLLNASLHARSRGVILKGDLPIGIFRHSVDAWTTPELFNQVGQAGAPPDPFSATGQNWGFPTYNWKVMAQDGYQWWKSRMIHLARYFGAYRIDHILGFFRIWEIPANQVDGLLGVFQPALPLTLSDFVQAGISFDDERFCNPYLPLELLEARLGDQAGKVIPLFFAPMGKGKYKFHPYTSQREVEQYLESEAGVAYRSFRESLFSLFGEVLLLRDKQRADAFHPRINLMETQSFKSLDFQSQEVFRSLHDSYFYRRQEDFWRMQAWEKLPAIKDATQMLICGEDLGMVPACVGGVMRDLGILTLEIQRMSKNPDTEFLEEKDIPFLSVVSPSTHDMAPVRTWWAESGPETIQRFFQSQLGGSGQAPEEATPEMVEKVIDLHLNWPSLWAVFPMQDLLGMDSDLRHSNPETERINVPANPRHYWRYRMHLTLEALQKRTDFSNKLASKVARFRGILPNSTPS